jgi:hypothetical protein
MEWARPGSEEMNKEDHWPAYQGFKMAAVRGLEKTGTFRQKAKIVEIVD